MPKPIKPVGNNPQQPSEWKRLTDWNEDCVPPTPGTYQIRYAPHGVPVDLNLRFDDFSFKQGEHARCDDLTGVVYIGKAVCFKDRFCKLLKTWNRLGASGANRNHGSYETWLSKKLQSKYPVGDLQFRYMPIGKEVWKPKIKNYVDELRAALLNQNGKSATDLTSITAFTQENSLLRRYLRCFGTLPPLNTMGPQVGVISDEDLVKIIEDLGKPECALGDSETA